MYISSNLIRQTVLCYDTWFFFCCPTLRSTFSFVFYFFFSLSVCHNICLAHKVPRIAKREFSLSIHWASSWDIPALFPRCSDSTKPKHEDNKQNSSTRDCVYWWEWFTNYSFPWFLHLYNLRYRYNISCCYKTYW